MVKSTSENALPNSNEKKTESRQKRSSRKSNFGQLPVLSPEAIFLVGFMGAGKSSVGRVLAQRLNWLFQDLDDLIEQRERRSVSEIFRECGESHFREAEHGALDQVLESISEKPGRVVALGGGAFAQPRNAALLERYRAHVVHLDAPVKVLWERCSRQAIEMGTNRPLLSSIDQFRDLYTAREDSYRMAAMTVQTEGRDFEEIAAEIAKRLNK